MRSIDFFETHPVFTHAEFVEAGEADGRSRATSNNLLAHAPEQPRHLDGARRPKRRIEESILLFRGHKVMLDADLASLYEVETRVLVQAVKRNLDRFPDDFMFQLTKEEFDLLRSQTVISSAKCRRVEFQHRDPERVANR